MSLDRISAQTRIPIHMHAIQFYLYHAGTGRDAGQDTFINARNIIR